MTKKEYKQKRPLVIAVDCDGTLWKRDKKYPECGTPRKEIIKQVNAFKKAGAIIILWTCRGTKAIEIMKAFCKEQDIAYDAINRNYRRFSKGFAKRKIFADYYVDDQMFSPDDFSKLDVETIVKIRQ